MQFLAVGDHHDEAALVSVLHFQTSPILDVGSSMYHVDAAVHLPISVSIAQPLFRVASFRFIAELVCFSFPVLEESGDPWLDRFVSGR